MTAELPQYDFDFGFEKEYELIDESILNDEERALIQGIIQEALEENTGQNISVLRAQTLVSFLSLKVDTTVQQDQISPYAFQMVGSRDKIFRSWTAAEVLNFLDLAITHDREISAEVVDKYERETAHLGQSEVTFAERNLHAWVRDTITEFQERLRRGETPWSQLPAQVDQT